MSMVSSRQWFLRVNGFFASQNNKTNRKGKKYINYSDSNRILEYKLTEVVFLRERATKRVDGGKIYLTQTYT